METGSSTSRAVPPGNGPASQGGHQARPSERFGRALDGSVGAPSRGHSPAEPRPDHALPHQAAQSRVQPIVLYPPADVPAKPAEPGESFPVAGAAMPTETGSSRANPALSATEIQPDDPIKPASPVAAGQRKPAFTPPMTAAAAAAASLAVRQRAVQRDRVLAADTIAATMEPLAAPAPGPQPLARPMRPAEPGDGGTDRQANEPSGIAAGDDLSLINGVSPREAGLLNDAGITRFSEIAGWSANDVRHMSSIVGGDRRIARENWIEQAQLLHQTGATAFTRRMPFGDPTIVRPVPHAGPTPIATLADIAWEAPPVPAAQARAAVDLAEPPVSVPSSARATVPPAPPPNVAERAAFGRLHRYRDNLQRVDGINAEVERLLNAQGVTRIDQIAAWSGDEQTRMDRLLGGMNRVKREDWVGQARRISGSGPGAAPIGGTGGHTVAPVPIDDAYASVVTLSAENAGPAPVRPGDEPLSNVTPLNITAGAGRRVRGLRSIRSEALIGGRSHGSESGGDDLKRIRGIGVLIEKRLRAMGYTTYADIGSWTQTDVDRVNQQLDFRGRIERESWIEQARILTAGGQTDFSRRIDRSGD